MPDTKEVRERLAVKTERADKHVLDLTEAINAFYESGPYAFSHKDDADSRERTFYVRFEKPIPREISAIIGDIIQNLRSSLDHLATHLVEIGTKPRVKKPYYPIFESAKKYEDGKMGKIEGMLPEAIKAIDATEPYARGNGWALWDLHTLNNRDKHCLLIPVWGSLIAHTYPKSEKEEIERVLKTTFPKGLSRGWLKAAADIRFLKDGDQLLSMPITELQELIDFRISIAFGEPEIVKGKQVIPTLQNMASIV